MGTITFESEGLYIVAIYIWLPPASYVVFLTTLVDLVTLTLKFDLLLNNFNLGHNFQTRSVRAFILHMCIPCVRTFHMVP